MKSSPKSDELPKAIESKTPTSARKLVQARLPFKTLGGCEPPVDTSTNNDISTASITNEVITPTRSNRKRKQTLTEDENVRAAKVNRRNTNDEDISAVTKSDKLESEHDVSVDHKQKDDAQSSSTTNNTNEKTGTDEGEGKKKSRAKRSLNTMQSQEPIKSRKSTDPEHFQIKLPMTKRGKKSKKPKKPADDVQPMDLDVDDDKNDDSECELIEDDGPNQKNTSKSSSDDGGAKSEDIDTESNDADELNESHCLDSSIRNDSSILDSSIDVLNESNPTTPKMTPKQLQRRVDSEKKILEKKQEREERERLKKLERDEKEEQRKREREDERRRKEEQKEEERKRREREREEKELLKKKEREEKEEQRKREKEDERKKREEKEELRKKEKDDERRRKEEQKEEERKRKEEQKEEERRKREEEKRTKTEFEQNKLKKTSAAFVKFFVPKKSDGTDGEKCDKSDTEQPCRAFMSFQIKEDMKIAPLIRRAFSDHDKSKLEQSMSSELAVSKLYVATLKNRAFTPGKSARTWIDDEYDAKSMNSDDLYIIDEGKDVQLIEEKPKRLHRAKFLKFAHNRRPPYYGTWRKKSTVVGPRRPFAQDKTFFDYEIDSDEEWEEEEPGESLHGTDDESEKEPEDDYDIDNDFFVPHGYLSDEEMQENEDDFDCNNDPENNKVKLKLIQEKFNDEMKKQTHKLKPRLIGLIWMSLDGGKPDNCSNGVWDLFNANAMLSNGPSIKIEPPNVEVHSDDEPTNKPRRLKIGEKELPDLIRLINGNQNNCNFLVREFQAHINKTQQGQREFSNTSIKQKIKELAFWQSCPEKGPMFEKMCWYVSRDTCKRYGVNDITLPNTWVYTIPPRKAVECDEKGEHTENKEQTPLDGIIEIDDDSNSCGLSGLTPQLVAQASSKPTNYNIAKFIRVLSEEEKKKQFHPITLRRDSADLLMADKQPSIESSSATRQTAKPASTTKKRASLLMSVPIGQEIPQKMKTTLVTQYLENSAKKRNRNGDDGDKNGDKKGAPETEVIVLE